MNLESLKRVVDKVPAFNSLSGPQVYQVLKAGSIRSCKAGDILCEKGDESSEMFILLSGKLRVRIGVMELWRVSSAEIVGEMSLITGLPRTATVETIEDSALFVIKKESMDSLLEGNPDLAAKVYRNMLESLCQKLRDTDLLLVGEDSTGRDLSGLVI